MIRRITLVNFMSHRNTVIEPADGLTVLTGQNNCGKSAIVTALQILSGNARGDFMVRHGERECVVAVETDDDHVIEWRRKGDTVSYRLNGRDVHRLQGSVPDELHDLLRLPAVQAEGGDFDVHFAEQKNPIFLLNEPSARRATFFASSSDAVKLIEMQNVHRRKTQNAKTRESEFIKREVKLGAQVEALRSLSDISEKLNDLESSHVAAVEGMRSSGKLRELRQGVENANQVFESWTAKTNLLNKLTLPPVLADAEYLADQIDALTTTAREVSFGSETIAALQSLTSAPKISNTAPLSDTITRLASTHSQVKLNAALQTACSSLSVPPQLPSTRAVSEAIQGLEVIVASTQSLRDKRAALAIVLAPPEIANTEHLEGTITHIKKAERERASKEALNIILQACEAPPAFYDSTSIRDQLEGQISAAKLAAAKCAECQYLATLTEPPKTIDLNGLASTIDGIVEASQQLSESEARVWELLDAFIDAEHSLLHQAEELGTCPVCRQEFDSEKLVELAVIQVGE